MAFRTSSRRCGSKVVAGCSLSAMVTPVCRLSRRMGRALCHSVTQRGAGGTVASRTNRAGSTDGRPLGAAIRFAIGALAACVVLAALVATRVLAAADLGATLAIQPMVGTGWDAIANVAA